MHSMYTLYTLYSIHRIPSRSSERFELKNSKCQILVCACLIDDSSSSGRFRFQIFKTIPKHIIRFWSIVSSKPHSLFALSSSWHQWDSLKLDGNLTLFGEIDCATSWFCQCLFDFTENCSMPKRPPSMTFTIALLFLSKNFSSSRQ